MVRREHETYRGTLDASGNDRRDGVYLDTQLGQQIGRAAFARDGSVAVLGDRYARCRRDDRGNRANVKCVLAVTAGAAGVQQIRRNLRPDRYGMFA